MSIVAAAQNDDHSQLSVERAVRVLLDNLPQPLPTIVKPGDRVFVKVNMGCSGVRSPADRFTTHPMFAENLIGALQDCGAHVSFGDDVARAGKYVERIWRVTGMLEVARRTGASLVDFTACGAKEVRSHLLYPRTYLISNARLDADVTINVANCRSHGGIVLSGAIKNMFGVVVGKRKALIHHLFRGNVRNFARAISDIHRIVKADLSFLDLTNFNAGIGRGTELRPVGIVLASLDPVAIDTLAAQAVGYDDVKIWPTYWGNRMKIGCSDTKRIEVRGIDWENFEKQSLKLPKLTPESSAGTIYDRITNLANHTILRPRPTINQKKCTGCGDCAGRCPVNCITHTLQGGFRNNVSRCSDCYSCLSVCEEGAVTLEFPGIARKLRRLTGKSLTIEAANIGRPTI